VRTSSRMAEDRGQMSDVRCRMTEPERVIITLHAPPVTAL
jgi:hypothetical protein